MLKRIFSTSVFALSFTAVGCADFERGPSPVPPDTFVADTGGGDALSGDTGGGCTPGDYESAIYPLIQLSCDSCHVSGAAAGSTGFVLTGTAADDYANIKANLNLTAPASSPLITKGTGKAHGGGAVWTAGSADVDELICWISAGAPQ